MKLGYESVLRTIDVSAGELTTLDFTLQPVAATGVLFHELQIGQGYIACGAYLYLVTVSNLNACVFDTNHKPHFEFTVPASGLKGIAQEVVWTKSSALTANKLIVYLWYKPVCDPTCDAEKKYAASNAQSPIRQYSDLSKETYPEDPVTFASLTFVGGAGPEVVIFAQQRITHYVTAFYNVPGDLGNYTALPA